MTIPTTPEQLLLDAAITFRFPLYPEGHPHWDVAEMAVEVDWRGGDRWAVKHRGWCYNAAGERELESTPGDRTDEFKSRFRFSRDEAVRIAREVVVPELRAVWDGRFGAVPAVTP